MLCKNHNHITCKYGIISPPNFSTYRFVQIIYLKVHVCKKLNETLIERYWRKYVHEVLVNRLGGLSLPRKSVVRLTDRPDMTLDVYRGRKTTMQQQQQI